MESVPPAARDESQTDQPQPTEDEFRPSADLASEAPRIAAAVEASPAYQRVWGGDAEIRTLFLSFVSEGAARMDSEGQVRVPMGDHFARLERAGLARVGVDLLACLARMGRFPPDFTSRVRSLFQTVASEPRRGLWTPRSAGGPPHDWTALAVLLASNDASALREAIAAKTDGPWPRGRRTWVELRPYLTDERHALRSLATFASLTSEEQARLERLESAEAARIAGSVDRRRELLSRYQREIPGYTGYGRAVVRGAGPDLRAIEVLHVNCSADDTVIDLFRADEAVLNEAGFTEASCGVPGGNARRVRFGG